MVSGAGAAHAQSPANAPRKIIRVGHVTEGAVLLDGQDSEPIWRNLKTATGFVQTSPNQGAAPTEQTEVRVAQSTRALFFFFRARHQDPSTIRGFLTQRDLESPSDWVQVWLSPQNDRQTGYQFAVNARGVLRDARFSQAGQALDPNWDAVWNAVVARNEKGWTAEFRIPLSQLRYDPNATEFGVQLVRVIAAQNEVSHFQPLENGAARPLLRLARLQGLHSLPRTGNLALRPYGLFRFEENAGTSFWKPLVGGDILYQPTGSTTIHATILPDFGQVEQDPSQLNLTAFEIFQAERRQFFLDGRENLLAPLAHRNFFQEQLYYSRRIGARPTTTFGVSSEDFTIYPQETTITGATKVLSRTSKGFSANLLSAWTQREIAEFDDGEGLIRQPVASPTSFNVGRVTQEVQGGRGYVSLAGTHVERLLDEELLNEQVRRATTGATDFDLRFGDLGVRGQVAGSHVHGSAEAIDDVQRSSTNNLQRVDAHHSKYNPQLTSLSGYSVALQGGKFDGNPWRATWGGRVRSPGLNTNDMGFLRIADQELLEGSLQYRWVEPTNIYRQITLETSGWFEKSWGPEITSAGMTLHSDWRLQNNWWGWIGGLRRVSALDPRLLRGGPAMRLPGGSSWWMGVHSDNRKKADGEIAFNGELGNQKSLRRLTFILRGFYRPTSSLNFSASPSFESRMDDRQYVDTIEEAGSDVYYLGRLHQETYALTLRASWALAVGLTLRLYAMPFVTVGRYEHFYRVTDPRADQYEERREIAEYDGDDRFLTTEFRSSVVLRWDYIPGSSAFAVWTHQQGNSRSDTGSLAPRRDLNALLQSDATDVVMLKWSYFWPL